MVFGIAVAISGSIGFYSPSLSEEELQRGALIGVLISLIGVVMIIMGRLELRANKRKDIGG